MQSIRKLIAVLKSEYISPVINMKDISENPFDQFEKWIKEVIKKKLSMLNAMHLATEGKNGMPSGRMMLFRGFHISPIQVEFWQGGDHRLHDPVLCRLEKDNFLNIQRLYP